MELSLMEQLIASLRVTLANTYEMYFKAHGHHWNVEGVEFPQYHKFFQKLYESLHDAADPIAEEIRKLDGQAPYGLNMITQFKTVKDSAIFGNNLRDMLLDLQNANNECIDALNESFKLASEQNLQGLMNFLAGRLEDHTKHGWMLRASLK